MSYAQPRTTSRMATGLIVTVALHIVLVYALITGLARKIVEVVRPPLETKIIEEVKPPAPPDKPPPPPPPKLAPPPPPYIPPPEVRVQVPVQPPPVITVAPTPPPPAPVVIAPTPPPAAPPAPVAPPVRTMPVVQAASCEKPEYPPAARRANETGKVLLSFLIDTNGKVLESKIERSSGSRRLDEAARQGLELCKFRPGTLDGRPVQAWARMEYVWTLQ
jgi:protein TonB